MKSQATNVDNYLQELQDDRREAISNIRTSILNNLPKGFEEVISYGMIGYVVPHSIYPNGYHCDKKLPLPFINIGNQKNFISLHHLGLYFDENLVNWFASEYENHSKTKLDMGKGCVRFKKINDIPLDLIGQLVSKISVENYIETYEKNLKR